MLQRYKQLLRTGKDFADLPDCWRLDEKKSSLIVASGKQQDFLAIKTERCGAQDRLDLFQHCFLSLGGSFIFRKTFKRIRILIKHLLPELCAGAVPLPLSGARVVLSAVHLFRPICHGLCGSLMSPNFGVPFSPSFFESSNIWWAASGPPRS